jgi:hypothetical protein
MIRQEHMNKFLVSRDKRGDFRFQVVGSDGRMLMRSIPYPDEAQCLQGIGNVLRNLDSDSCFELWKTFKGDFYFHFYDDRGEVVATSDIFPTKDEQQRVMESIRDMQGDHPIGEVAFRDLPKAV